MRLHPIPLEHVTGVYDTRALRRKEALGMIRYPMQALC